jgi:hypothetical protein
MPDEPADARNWLDRRERALRKNARVIDKIRIALPRELDEFQRANLVHDFMRELTGGCIPWYAAIHQQGKDAHNPHAHIAIHDRDTQTGQRILRLSDSSRDRLKAGLPGPKAVDWIRERWELACNDALERAGIDKRVDRRTLEAQGIDRLPTIHEGPRAQHIEGTVKRPRSKERKNGCGRVIDYPSIDKGRTRREFNAHIVDLNLERAARSKNTLTAVWAQFEKAQRAKDQELEKRLAAEARARTADYRNASLVYLARINRLRSERTVKIRAAERKVREKFDALRTALRERQEKERSALKDRQSRLYIRIFALLDITGKTRRRQEEARKTLSASHQAERKELSARYRLMRSVAKDAVRARYKGDIAYQHQKRSQHLAQLKTRHVQAENFSDIERQRREADRELTRQLTEQKIENWKERVDSGQKVVASDFAQAIVKAAKQEAQHLKATGKDRDKDISL